MAGVLKLLKTQSNGDQDLFDATADINKSGTPTLKLKVTQFSIDIKTPTVDGTEEQKSVLTTVYQQRFHTGRVEGDASFQGYIISGSLVGLQNLPVEEVDVKVRIGKHQNDGTVHQVAFRMAVERVKVDWARQAVGIPVAIQGKITDRFEGAGTYPVAETIS